MRAVHRASIAAKVTRLCRIPRDAMSSSASADEFRHKDVTFVSSGAAPMPSMHNEVTFARLWPVQCCGVPDRWAREEQRLRVVFELLKACCPCWQAFKQLKTSKH